MANEITVELNDEQFERYQIMEENGLSVGEAIDLIFYLRDHYGVRNDQHKLKDTAYDFEAKEKILEKEYAAIDDSYEMKVQDHKRVIKWGKFFDSIL